jgi:hypothetical protein
MNENKVSMPDWVLGWTGFITRNTHVEYNKLTIIDGYEWYEYMWNMWLQNSDLGREYLENTTYEKNNTKN